MLNELPNLLKPISKEFKNRHQEIVDIVMYGSAVKGKVVFVGDIDIMLLFKDTALKERLEIVQAFKQKAKRIGYILDVKSMNLTDFTDETFLARQNILIEGRSLLSGKKLSEVFGFRGFTIFTYRLKHMDNTTKTKFTYALIGRKKAKGMIREVQGIPLGKGAVQVPIEYSLRFRAFLEHWNVPVQARDVLIPFY